MSSIAGRLGLWRLWRNRVGRALYDGLRRAGIVLAAMVRYEAPPAPAAESASAPSAFSLSAWPGPDPARPAGGPEDLTPEDVLIGARIDDELVGYCVLSARPVDVGEIGATVDPDGVYLWDLYVEPAYRGRGLGTALLGRARRARATDRAGGLSALVAADNRPSRAAFRSAGFRPVERLVSVGLGDRQYRRRTPVDPRPDP